MYRIDNGTQVLERPAAPEPNGSPGFFVDCDAGSLVGGTTISAHWLNMMQEEMAAVAVMNGAPLNRLSSTQLRDALIAYVASKTVDATQAAKGVTKYATSLLAQGWADDTVALTPWSLPQAFKGANQSLAAAGFQRLPGGLIFQWGTATLTGGTTVTFPFAFPGRCVTVALGRTASVSGLAEYAQITAIGTNSFSAVALEGNGSWVSSTFAIDWFAVGY